MDPDATLDDLKAAIKEEDWDDAIDSATALLRWLVMDGFPPTNLYRPIDVPPHAPEDLAMAIDSIQTLGW